jgi:hypothetical protein
MPRTLVVYHYYESDSIHRDNLDYFLKHGYNDEVDYIILLAGGCTLELPVVSNIRYVHIANPGIDFGGHAHAINSEIDRDNYTYFIFLNSTVRGPFLPAYCRVPWTRLFTDMLDGDVHLAGATINILSSVGGFGLDFGQRYGFRPPFAHVQSMIFALDRTALEFLIDRNFFERPIGPNKHDVIIDYEILLSQLMIQNGWNISCILPEYRTIDYRRLTGDINPASTRGDPCFAGGYFHRSMSPYEVIFIKTNRNVIPLEALQQIGRSQDSRIDASRESSFDASHFDAILNKLDSAWKGHKNFAIWLVRRLRPAVIVDLGVDFGFSTLCFAVPGVGHVYGVDAFEGDEHAGFRDTKSAVEKCIEQLRLKNVTLIKGYFDDVSKTWARDIDILHIDGRHKYEDVRNDFSNWIGFLSQTGIVLLHDTCVTNFGVRRFFDEIELPKVNLWNSHGLGLISKDPALIAEISSVFEKLIEPGTIQGCSALNAGSGFQDVVDVEGGAPSGVFDVGVLARAVQIIGEGA